MFDVRKIALQAYRLSGEQRKKFLEKHCDGDVSKEAMLQDQIAKLDAVHATLLPDARYADPGQTMDPGQTTDPGQSTDPVQAREQDGPAESHGTSNPVETSDAFSADDEDRRTSDANRYDATLSSAPPFGDGTGMTMDLGFENHLEPSDQVQADDILDRYRADSFGQQLPDWSRYVTDDLSEAVRQYVVEQLVMLDIAARKRQHLPIDLASYVNGFPDFRDAIQKVISLKSNDERTPGILRKTAPESRRGPGMLPQSSTRASGSLRYVPGKMHAKGGLGAIYRGHDTELGRTVALKRILPKYEDIPECRDRFVFEASVTGSLEHPGIVPIYGLSTYDGEKPFYAMRFIRGRCFAEEITKFHKSNPRLNASSFDSREFRGLLRRLIDACNAMHFAHSRGVLHRDLKPDNIMLGKYGETLVVDWGLAWVMPATAQANVSMAQSSETLPVPKPKGSTREGSAVGTPCYMSPEQAMGVHDKLTPATDIYALGAILFRIASDEHCVAGGSTLEVVMNVRDGKLQDLRSLVPGIPRPIASICRRAMDHNPSKRYANASELADDIDRWMTDEPVAAHAKFETYREKLARMIRRHRSWTLAAAVSLLAITIVAVFAAIFIESAKAREEVAKLQAQKFKGEALDRYRQSRKAIDTWLVQSNDALQYFPGTRSVRSRLLQIAAEDYEMLASNQSDDPEIELERIRAIIRLGDLQQTGNQWATARDTYQRAIDSIDDAQAGGSLAAYRFERGHAQSRMGLTWVQDEDIERAKQAYSVAVGQLEQGGPARPASASRYLASTYIHFAEAVLMENGFDEAERYLKNGVTAIDQIGDAMQPRDTIMKSRAWELLARMKLTKGDMEAATQHLKEASVWVRELVASQPDHPEYADALASLLIINATIARQSGDHEREGRSLKEAIKQYRALQAAIPDFPIHQENLALTLTDLGLAHHELRHCVEAVRILEESLDVLNNLSKAYGPIPRYRQTIAAAQDGLGQAYLEIGSHEKSQDNLTKALITYQQLSEEFPEQPDYHERSAIAQSHLAQAIARTAEGPEKAFSADLVAMVDSGFTSARSTLEQLCEAFTDVPQYRKSLAHVCFEHALALERLGDTQSQAARDAWDTAAEIWRQFHAQGDATAAERLAWLLLLDKEAGEERFQEAIDAARDAYEANPKAARTGGTLALAYLAVDRLDDASATSREWASGSQKLDGRQNVILSKIARANGQDTEAASYQERADKWFAAHAPQHRERSIELPR